MMVVPDTVRMVSGVDDQLIERLKAEGLRVTAQRLLIHRLLREHSGHLSAEVVRERLDERLPGVSQQTVYNTLQLLADLGVIRRVPVPGSSARFEVRLDVHHHAACESCGDVQDLEAPLALDAVLQAARQSGFAPSGASVVVLGRCARCGAAQRAA